MLATQYSWLLAARLGSAALQAVALVLLARWVGPLAFGLTAAVMGVLTVAGALADLGLGPLLLRERATDPAYALTGQILLLNARTSTALALVAAGSLAVLARATENSQLYELIPLAVWVAAEKNSDVWLNVSTADGRTHLTTLSILLRRGLGMLLFTALTPIVPTVLAFSLGLALGSVVANLLLRRRIDPGPSAAPVAFGTLARRARPFYLNSVAAQARNLDVALVSAIAGPVAAGTYAVPARLTSPLRMLPTSLSPLIVRYAALGTPGALRAVRQLTTAVMLVMPAFMLAVALAAPWLIEVALGQSYGSAVLPLRIICLGLVFAFAVSLLTGFLQGLGEEHYVGSVAVVVTGFALVSLAAGTWLGGATGAACAVSSTFLVHSVLLAIRTHARLKERTDD